MLKIMPITTQQLKHLCNLAYLETNPASEPKLNEELNSIVNFVEQLRSVDTSNIQPLTHPMDVCQRLRPDEPQLNNVALKLGQIAPHFEDNLYLVPKVLK